MSNRPVFLGFMIDLLVPLPACPDALLAT